MMRAIKNIIALTLAVFLIYVFRAPLQATVVPAWNNAIGYIFAPDACEEPIPYSIGSFDTKFNISRDYFLTALKEAEAIWEKATSKDLFVYAPDDDSYNNLKVNLVYDYRQQATKTLNNLGIVVEDTKASYDSLKAKFEAQKIAYERDKQALNSAINSFNTKSQAYDKDVAFWNAKGGAPEQTFRELEARRAALEAELKLLKQREQNLSKKADEINSMVVALNRLASSLNLNVDRYNNVNDARGESFEEGVYYSEGAKHYIDIFEFSSRDKLVRVLAHEFGHALGLDHVEDKNAIMYLYNTSSNSSLSPADIEQLEIVCD